MLPSDFEENCPITNLLLEFIEFENSVPLSFSIFDEEVVTWQYPKYVIKIKYSSDVFMVYLLTHAFSYFLNRKNHNYKLYFFVSIRKCYYVIHEYIYIRLKIVSLFKSNMRITE